MELDRLKQNYMYYCSTSASDSSHSFKKLYLIATDEVIGLHALKSKKMKHIKVSF